MRDYYVYLDNEGYIESWSTLYNEDFTKIQSDQELYEKYNCVKVVNGIAVLDEEKERIIEFEKQLPSDKDITMEAISDLAELISELMEGSETNG